LILELHLTFFDVRQEFLDVYQIPVFIMCVGVFYLNKIKT